MEVASPQHISIATGLRASYTNKIDYTVQDALAKLQNTHSNFEVLKRINRLYFDIDGKGFDPSQYNELHAKTLATIHNIIPFNFGDKYAVLDASSSAINKISFRVIVTSTTADLATNKKIVAQLNKDYPLPEPCAFDSCCYGNNQKIRMLGSSKDGEDRPFKLIHGNPIDTLITYIPEDTHPIEYDPSDGSDSSSSDPRVFVEVDQTKLSQYLDCISVERWTSYQTCLQLIWAMRYCEASSDLIHNYCKKAHNYERKWVDDAIHNFNPAKSPTLSYIKKYAKLDNQKQYLAIPTSKEENVKELIEEHTRLDTDENTIFDTARWLSPLPEFKTLCVKSMLGTGKTRRLIEYIKSLPSTARILVLSGRITWSDHIYEELAPLGFIHYGTEKDAHKTRTKHKLTHIANPRIILQIHPNSFALIEGERYDAVVIDESETALSMMTPLSIYKDMGLFMRMTETFENIIVSAKQVICLDALLTQGRTVDLINDLRGSTKLMINTTLPYDKKATLYTSENQFYTKIQDAIINKGKRVVSMWGTEKAGTQFYDTLSKKEISNQFYHAKTNQEIKTRDMANVNKYWAEKQCIGYTGCITVGINYTNKDALFDTTSLYASSWGCGARDYAQGLHRAREIKDNTVHLYISPNLKPCMMEAGMQNQQILWDKDIEVRKRVLSDLGENPENFGTVKPWLKKLIMYNRNEIALNRKHFKELVLHYLQLCGISVVQEIEIEQTAEKKKAGGIGIPTIEDVSDIDGEQANFLDAHRKTLTTEEKYQLEKFYLNLRVSKIDQFIWEQWLKNKYVVENAYHFIHNKPADLVNTNIIELVSKDVGRLQTIKSCGLDFNSSFSISIEDMPHINIDTFGIRIRSEKDTHEQHCRNVCSAFQKWGLDISVQSKRKRVGDDLIYKYSVVFDRDKSVVAYITKSDE